MKKLLLIIALFITEQTYCQQLHLKVVNAESLEGLPMAKITCSLDKNFVIYSNQSGNFSLTYSKEDTITISKKDFHSIHLYLPHANVDTIHIITISMVPSIDNNSPNVKNISGLPMFEYYFVHKTEENNNLKVQVFENKNAIQQRQQNTFKIASVHLNDFHKQQKK